MLKVKVREPSALEGWIRGILCCDPKRSRVLLRILSTEGRGVRLCGAKSQPKGPKVRKVLVQSRVDHARGKNIHVQSTTDYRGTSLMGESQPLGKPEDHTNRWTVGS